MIGELCLAAACWVVPGPALSEDPPPARTEDRREESAVKADAAKRDAVRPIDAELLRLLEKQAAPETPEEPLLVRIGQRMRDVQGRLIKADPGDETRGLQEEIVRDLDKLIEELKKGGT